LEWTFPPLAGSFKFFDPVMRAEAAQRKVFIVVSLRLTPATLVSGKCSRFLSGAQALIDNALFARLFVFFA